MQVRVLTIDVWKVGFEVFNYFQVGLDWSIASWMRESREPEPDSLTPPALLQIGASSPTNSFPR